MGEVINIFVVVAVAAVGGAQCVMLTIHRELLLLRWRTSLLRVYQRGRTAHSCILDIAIVVVVLAWAPWLVVVWVAVARAVRRLGHGWNLPSSMGPSVL